MRNETFKKVYGSIPEQEDWKTRTNQEKRGLYKAPDMAADIKRRKVE
jgi:hypothetical protein